MVEFDVSPVEGQFTLVEGVSAGADGYVYGFTVLTDKVPEPFSDAEPLKYTFGGASMPVQYLNEEGLLGVE